MALSKSDSPQAKQALSLLTAVNYLNYIDRFILAALLSSIQKDLNLSDLQGGLLATAFMLAYIMTSPIFGILVHQFRRALILMVGVIIWSLASIVTGIAGEFYLIFASRFLLGIGESIFTTVSGPFLTDFFSVERRARAFSIYASGAPAGAALGYVLGGFLGGILGWRNSFFIVGIPGFILAYLISRLPEPRGDEKQAEINIKDALNVLFKNRPFVCAVLGFTAYTFVVGGLAHWMPSYIQRSFSMDAAKANMLFGAITVISGFLGTLLGGQWSQRVHQKRKFGFLYFSAICMMLMIPFYLASFFTSNLVIFIGLMAITQFLFFLPMSPINVLIIECVPVPLRTLAMAVSIFACHILGDAISSPLIGWISDQSGSLRFGMIWCAPVIFLGGVFWLLGMREKVINRPI